MASKAILLILFIVSPAVLGQTAGPVDTNEDNRSQIPIFLDQHMIHVIANDLKSGHNDEAAIFKATEESIRQDLDDLSNPPKETDVSASTSDIKNEPVHAKDTGSVSVTKDTPLSDDVTSPPVPGPSDVKPQVPIFLNQHMFNVIDGMNNKDDTATQRPKESTEVVNPEPAAKMPIFLNQEIIKHIVDMDKDAKAAAQPVVKETTTHPIQLPEPHYHYTNSFLLRGHHQDSAVHHHVIVLLSSAMTQSLSDGHHELIVYPLSTTYEYTASGFEVTRITYAVTYNGRVLANYEVTRALRKPRPSQYIRDGLNKHNLVEHPQAYKEPSQKHHGDSVRPWVITLITLAVVALVLLLITVVYVKRVKARHSKSKDKKKKLMKYILEADKKATSRGFKPVEPVKPPPYSENAAFTV